MLNTNHYRLAPGGDGPFAGEWKDKPHRLIYDLCREIEKFQGIEIDPVTKLVPEQDLLTGLQKFNKDYGHTWALESHRQGGSDGTHVLDLGKRFLHARRAHRYRRWVVVENNLEEMVQEAVEFVQSYRAILVAKEKHGTRYFDASTNPKLAAAALKLVKQRSEEGWYYEPEEPDHPGYTDETLNTVPIGLQQEAKRRLQIYKRDLDEYNHAKDFWDELQKALSTNDGNLAWTCLEIRSKHEYEHVDLEELEDGNEN